MEAVFKLIWFSCMRMSWLRSSTVERCIFFRPVFVWSRSTSYRANPIELRFCVPGNWTPDLYLCDGKKIEITVPNQTWLTPLLSHLLPISITDLSPKSIGSILIFRALLRSFLVKKDLNLFRLRSIFNILDWKRLLKSAVKDLWHKAVVNQPNLCIIYFIPHVVIYLFHNTCKLTKQIFCTPNFGSPKSIIHSQMFNPKKTQSCEKTTYVCASFPY